MQFPDGPRDLGLLTTIEALLPRAQGGLGLTHRALRWRVDSGRWQRLHSGVYLMSSGPVNWITRAGAALLAYGDAAALCDRSAGYLHGLVDDPGAVVHVLVPRAARPHEHAGTQLHRSGRRPIIPAWPARTSYEATVVDLATSSRVDDLASLLASALRTRRTTEARIGMALQRLRTHPQRLLLLDLLGASSAGAVGALELRFVRDVLRRHALPVGVGQFPAAGLGVASRPHEPGIARAVLAGGAPDAGVADRRRFDRAVPDYRVLFELDGALYHQGARRVADRRKAILASRHDWLLLRYGWTETVDEPCRSAAEILEVLQERGWRGAARGCGPGCAVARALARRAG